ncbi:hypothetical protein SLS55_007501 [Diplodia seriata]|uniref:LysM domain-containing protein n=1 Tax=Diplodia seriata TaxID=420778 RepID=A0ABR3CCH9_9PEZI
MALRLGLIASSVCNGTISLDTSTQQYVIQSGDTLTTIAEQFNRGICDIFYANNLTNPDLIVTGDTLVIPPQTCFLDDTTCLGPQTTPTATCIPGGPGFYIVQSGDTLSALSILFNITLDSIIQANSQNIPNPDLIEIGQVVNIPICPGTQCHISPYSIQPGDVFVDLAEKYLTSAGQILALNPGVDSNALEPGQVITLPSYCGVVPGLAGAEEQGNWTAPASDEKAVDEKKGTATAVEEDVEVVVAYQDGDEIRESDYTEEQYKKLLRKIDRYLLPLMWFCYGIQQTDKTALSTQAIFGLRICVIAIAAAQNWNHLMAIRGLQGFFECTISPGFVLVVGSWYRREEHSSRALFWQSANAGFGIIANLVMYGIGSHAEKYGGLAPWRCISLFLGSTTIVLALICFALLGSPKEVHWMSKEEKRMAAARILKNKAGRDVTGVKWSWPQVGEAFRDPQLWFSMINAFLSSVPNGALTTFGGLMYKSFGFDELQVLLIEIPRSVTSLVIFLIVGIYTRKVANRRMYIMAAATIPPFIGMLALALLENTHENRWIKWGMYLMTVPFVLSLFLAWTLIPSNVAGRTKKTIISSATFLGYCVGNMCGSQIFKSADAPRYIPGTIGASVALGAEFVLICAWRVYYVRQNKIRDRAAAESGVSEEERERVGRQMGEGDVTDLGNPHFRYTT